MTRVRHHILGLAVLAGIGLMPCRAEGPQSRPSATAVRGIAEFIEFHAPGPTLRATANQLRISPMLLRMVEARPEKEGSVFYRVEYIGLVAGEYDLRNYLERQDGSPLNLAPLPVSVLSKLDVSHGTDLFSSSQMAPLRYIRYRLVMLTLAAAWLSLPVIYGLIRLARRRPPPPVQVAAPPPSLAEQLRPLAEAAIRGSLSLAERARLELLMYLYWREQLGLIGPQAEVVHALRRDARAGRLLRAVEGWLHSGHAPAGQVEQEVAALLEPYRAASAIPQNGDRPPGPPDPAVVEHAR